MGVVLVYWDFRNRQGLRRMGDSGLGWRLFIFVYFLFGGKESSAPPRPHSRSLGILCCLQIKGVDFGDE